ncbi:hypothetical protein GNP84_06780 [Aliivibrio fischeri]|uniref:PIG-L family deacetylase n=1 Tax=Aliivibrio fischeri TaxID=668 RepID=UPI0012D925E8|nr:PIG-L family deacetylase [Aliivibrio fischeri]MUJ27933.1 hypothetical protein [Aliivibrio fischeri]MUK76610.1 hypothetical protein [Aliivibrio fischeri]
MILNRKFKAKYIALTTLALLVSMPSQSTEYKPTSFEGQVVVISPHQDDALLTFTGYLTASQQTAPLARNEINVMFGLSNYSTNWNDVLTQTQVGGISKRRYQEDFDALSELFNGWSNFHYKLQGLWDAPLRLYTGESTAGGGSAGTFANFRDEEIEAFNFAVEAIKPILKRENTTVLVPIANGSHIDHFITREAVIKAAYDLGINAKAQIIFGQDQPYTNANPSDLNVEFDALRARLPSNSFILENFNVPSSDIAGENLKLYLYKKHYLTQYDEGYIEPLTTNLQETVYIWNKATYNEIQTHPDCAGDYCQLNEINIK